MDENPKYDLSRPAFAPIEESEPSKENTEEEKVESPEEKVQKETVEPEEPVKEEPRVPYTRFKKVRESELQALREKAELEARLQELEDSRQTYRPQRQSYSPTEPPEWWTKLYGDSDASKQAWEIQARHEEELREDARQYAVEALKEEQRADSVRVSNNLTTIDENLDDLSAYVGRNLTEEEQSSVLSIVDEYTPKDEDGSYLGAMIPFEKAWEVHEMRLHSATASQKKSRDNVSSLVNSRTTGTPDNSVQAQEDKNFNPRDWDAWRKKLPQ